MARPGISRAVTMGIVGFIVGCLVVIAMRALQSLDPVWEPGVGLVFGTFFAAGFFIWGIGGFDPRMSVHGEGHEEEAAHAHAEAEAAGIPAFSSAMWQIAFATVVFVVAVAVMALLGPALIIAADPAADARAVATVPLVIGTTELQVSQLAVFVGFILFTLVSLAVAAYLMSFVVTFLSRGIAQTTAGVPASAPVERTPVAEGPRQAIGFLVVFIILFVVLYLLFYYVLIGMVLQMPPLQLALISALNALLFTILILRASWVVSLVARVAGWLAHVLRGGDRVDGTARPERRNRP